MSPDVVRCPWSLHSPLERDYHDAEWGVPTAEDRRLFEFLVLESAQAGLSWLTILRKRQGYGAAFADFEPLAVSRFGPVEVERLLANPAIVRNRKKIEAAVGNARAFLELQAAHGSFARYIWGFVDGRPRVNRWTEVGQVPAVTPLAETLAKDMKRRGFRFFGPTVAYAHMQATGMVNDHLVSCHRWQPCAELAERFSVE